MPGGDGGGDVLVCLSASVCVSECVWVSVCICNYAIVQICRLEDRLQEFFLFFSHMGSRDQI